MWIWESISSVIAIHSTHTQRQVQIQTTGQTVERKDRNEKQEEERERKQVRDKAQHKRVEEAEGLNNSSLMKGLGGGCRELKVVTAAAAICVHVVVPSHQRHWSSLALANIYLHPGSLQTALSPCLIGKLLNFMHFSHILTTRLTPLDLLFYFA